MKPIIILTLPHTTRICDCIHRTLSLAVWSLISTMALHDQSDPNSRYPSIADADNTITQNGFTITTRKLPILKAQPIENMTNDLGIAPPEMIFGNNRISIDHQSGWSINFNTYDALDRVDKTGDSMLQVAHSREWQSTRYGTLDARR